MVSQIAEGGGIALLAGEEVLVDAQHLGADRRMILAGSPWQAAQKVALHGGGAGGISPYFADASPRTSVIVPPLRAMLLISY